MARSKKREPTPREVAENLQWAFDAAVRDLDPEWRPGRLLPRFVEETVYGGVHAEAIAEDADRSQAEWGYLLRSIEYRVDAARASVDKFAGDLAVNPYAAFRWATEAVKAAAVLEVFTRLLGYLNGHGPSAAVLDEVDRRVFDGARNVVNQSTSPMATLTERAELEAWADFRRDYREALR